MGIVKKTHTQYFVQNLWYTLQVSQTFIFSTLTSTKWNWRSKKKLKLFFFSCLQSTIILQCQIQVTKFFFINLLDHLSYIQCFSCVFFCFIIVSGDNK